MVMTSIVDRCGCTTNRVGTIEVGDGGNLIDTIVDDGGLGGTIVDDGSLDGAIVNDGNLCVAFVNGGNLGRAIGSSSSSSNPLSAIAIAAGDDDSLVVPTVEADVDGASSPYRLPQSIDSNLFRHRHTA